MSINGVNNSQIANYQGASTSSGDLTSKDVFFKILAAELSNQDPLKGKDGTEYVAQLAQFTNLEQTQQLYTAVNRMLMSQSISEGGMMIGKEVDFAIGEKDGKYITETGVVTSVKIEGGQVYLYTEDGKKYALQQSIAFRAAPEKPVEAPKEDEKVDNKSDEDGKVDEVDNAGETVEP